MQIQTQMKINIVIFLNNLMDHNIHQITILKKTTKTTKNVIIQKC